MNFTQFPQPVRIANGTTRWPLSGILQFEAERAGAQAPRLDPKEERYLSARNVAARLSVGVSTVWRWTAQSAEHREVA